VNPDSPQPATAAISPITVEVDMGSASSRGRTPDRSWLIRLRHDQDSVIVAIGLARVPAGHLAAHIADFLAAASLPAQTTPARHGD
jgi:hypothetical protein